jgi:hypothetical protein
MLGGTETLGEANTQQKRVKQGSTVIELYLSERDRQLIAKYTWPFEEFQEQLNRLEGQPGMAKATIDPFYLDRLLADIVVSAKKITDESLLDELDALYSELEARTVTSTCSV